LRQKYTITTDSVSDNGPNQGYKYVASITSSHSGVSTAYLYVVPPDAEDTGSTFYVHQCGNYDAQNNPGGYISGSNLLAGITRHESGSGNSHYANYVAAQDNTSNNLGVVAEALTGTPSTSSTDFTNSAVSTLNDKVTAILTAAQVEPCEVNKDASCNVLGNINFSPYQSCP